jgi:hypothetical protein
MSGHSTANIVGEMGYNHYIDTKIKSKDLKKGGLESNEIKKNFMKKDLKHAHIARHSFLKRG